ncbi:MAG: hypothetical protein IJ038_01685 [Clostridia bacterium]|nr:hypothetical protein [Clostridia bacterium]
MRYDINLRRRRRRLSVWGIVFSAISCLFGASVSAENSADTEFRVRELSAMIGSEARISDVGAEKAGLIGIILTVLAAIAIIAVIIFSVRGKDD